MNKSNLYVEIGKRWKPVAVLTRKFAIPNLDVKVWKWKNNIPKGNQLCYLTKPTITRQRQLEVTEIEYYEIKCEGDRMERAE